MALNAQVSLDPGSGVYVAPCISFVQKYGVIPSTYDGTYYFEITKMLNFLKKKYPKMLIEPESCIHYVRDKHGKARVKDAILFLGPFLAFGIDVQSGEIDTEYGKEWYREGESPKVAKAEAEHFKADISICFVSSEVDIETVEKLMNEILEFKVEPKRKSELHFLCVEEGNLVLKSLELKSPVLDIALNYGQKFKDLHDYVFDRLVGDENKNKGLVLLYGTPGTGKTFYIRHLISLLSDKKRVIYIPPDMVGELSSPKFLPFLMKYPESILIVEDGENVIKSRKGGQNQAVSNLLNAADGLLSDALNVQIICTFNCKLTDVDDALLRKGRLIGKHEFKALNIADAQAVLDHLKIDFKATEEMTLADIYNCKEKTFVEDRPTFGFTKKD